MLKELHEPHYNCKCQKQKANTKSKFSYIHISLPFIQNYCRHYKPRSTPWPCTLTPLTTNSNKSQKCELKCHATTAFAEGQNMHRQETSRTLIERLGGSKSEERPGHVTKYHTSTVNAVTLFLPRLWKTNNGHYSDACTSLSQLFGVLNNNKKKNK